MIDKIFDYYHTLRHVTPTQFYYRVKYSLSPVKSLPKKSFEEGDIQPLKQLTRPLQKKIITETDPGFKVNILNLSAEYPDQIDWSDQRYGILWNYHLQYADFLHQDDLPVQTRKELILNLYDWLYTGRLTPESYPASLRCMNVIRFLCSGHERDKASDQKILDGLYSELHFLENRLEFHLMGNHLMENAFSLLMGGTFFNHSPWIQLGERILTEQITGQILRDGAHYERSPMYHSLMLYRFLEAIYYLPDDSNLTGFFRETVEKMLSWLLHMSFTNGDFAHVNDSVQDHSFSKDEILEAANLCSCTKISHLTLSDSGFKRFDNENFELLVDAAGIEPSSQPGHSHADSLSFILYFRGKPLITDPAVSTYEAGNRRDWERSTKAHNTVTFDGQNTADVWNAFRVGRRPVVKVLNESQSNVTIQLRHKLKSGEIFEHQRNFEFSDEFIEIKDHINLDKPVKGKLYFDPSIAVKTLHPLMAELSNGISIHFNGIEHFDQFRYDYCKDFNLRIASVAIEYSFTKYSSLKIVTPQV